MSEEEQEEAEDRTREREGRNKASNPEKNPSRHDIILIILNFTFKEEQTKKTQRKRHA